MPPILVSCTKCGKTRYYYYSQLLKKSYKVCFKCRRGTYIKHGENRVNSPLYKTWGNIRWRCKDPDKWSLYGGRGISMCKEWGNYLTFKQWSLENGYNRGLQIDRIDNTLGYFPENCRWVTAKEQNHNRRNVKLSVKKAEEIRTFYRSGEYSQKKLGKIFGVCSSMISCVTRGKNWK